MFKFLRKLFYGPEDPMSTIEALQSVSSDILDVFSNTADQLEAVNDEVQKEMDERAEEVERIQIEQEALARIKASNNKIIKKIGQFLND